MAKTLIDIDESVLAAAAAELGTTTKKDTVNEALRLVARRQQRARRILDEAAGLDENPYAHLGIGADITDPEIMKGARR